MVVAGRYFDPRTGGYSKANLGTKQKAKAQQIKQNQGASAARDYRRGVMDKKGYQFDPRQQLATAQPDAGVGAGPENPTQADPTPEASPETPEMDMGTYRPISDFGSGNKQYQTTQEIGPTDPSYDFQAQGAFGPGVDYGFQGAGGFGPDVNYGYQGQASFGPEGANREYNSRSVREFMPQTAEDYQADPMLDWRVQQGEKALNKRLAAQGLAGSGDAVKQDIGLVNDLTASDVERQTQLGLTDASRFDSNQQRVDALARGDQDAYQQNQQFRQGASQFDAGRYDQNQAMRQQAGQFDAGRYDQNQGRMDQANQFEAGRYDQYADRDWRQSQADASRYDQQKQNEIGQRNLVDDRAWGRTTDMMDFYNNQNPLSSAMGGLSGYGNAQLTGAQLIPGMTMDDYSRYFQGGTGTASQVPGYNPYAGMF